MLAQSLRALAIGSLLLLLLLLALLKLRRLHLTGLAGVAIAHEWIVRDRQRAEVSRVRLPGDEGVRRSLCEFSKAREKRGIPLII